MLDTRVKRGSTENSLHIMGTLSPTPLPGRSANTHGHDPWIWDGRICREKGDTKASYQVTHKTIRMGACRKADNTPSWGEERQSAVWTPRFLTRSITVINTVVGGRLISRVLPTVPHCERCSCTARGFGGLEAWI